MVSVTQRGLEFPHSGAAFTSHALSNILNEPAGGEGESGISTSFSSAA